MRLCPHCESRYDDTIVSCPDDGEGTIPVAASLAERLMGETLDGRWKIERLLGEGGMGAVFRGTQLKLDRPVAIKVLQPAVADDERVIARFLREAKVLSTLQHPHVVTILDFGRDEKSGLLYLVMELLVGEPLDRWQRVAGNVTVPRTLSIAEQIVTALAETHTLGIIHRDLKPHNVFIQTVANGLHVKVLDFGIAKVQDRAAQTLTQAGAIEGTPHYMAPEQVEGGQIGPQTDFYALGGILYEMLAGEPPFDGDTLMSILMKQCHHAPPPLAARWRLTAVKPYVGLVELVMRLLAKSVKDRPQSAKALLSELQALSEDYVEEVSQTEDVFAQTLAPGQRFEGASETPANLHLSSPITASGEMSVVEDGAANRLEVKAVSAPAVSAEMEGLKGTQDRETPPPARRTVLEDMDTTSPLAREGRSRSWIVLASKVLVAAGLIVLALLSLPETARTPELPERPRPDEPTRKAEPKDVVKAATAERDLSAVPPSDKLGPPKGGDLATPTPLEVPPILEVKGAVDDPVPKKKERHVPKSRPAPASSDGGLDAELERMAR